MKRLAWYQLAHLPVEQHAVDCMCFVCYGERIDSEAWTGHRPGRVSRWLRQLRSWWRT